MWPAVARRSARSSGNCCRWCRQFSAPRPGAGWPGSARQPRPGSRSGSAVGCSICRTRQSPRSRCSPARQPSNPSGDIMVKIDADALAAIATRFAARGGQPGLAYGVIANGQLVHSGGHGERWLGGPPPDAGTVFRIASMTKSFTATLVLMLRDRGALRLDDHAVGYVPVLAGVEMPSADSPPITIRNLLTMTAGFPTDDPWGDRQQGLDPAVFAQLLADGTVRCAWAPGTRFDYSNLGYAVLGKVIESVTGLDYTSAIRTEVLGPLGLTQTGYEASNFDPAQLARGYRRDGADWRELAPDPHGAFAPMGGIFSTVADLAH